jgi:steroid delta-isomerase-like uncharacterized protein
VRALLREWWAPLLRDWPGRWKTSENQIHTALSMCRALHTLAHGTVVSKLAALWACETLGGRWAGLIEECLAWRPGLRLEALPQVAEFVRYTLVRAGESGDDSMTTEQNKALVRRFYEEVWGKGNFEAADDIFAADYVRHDLRPGQAPAGPAGQKQISADFRAAFSDLRMTIDLMLAEGDLVAARWTTEGTNTGAWGGVPPTGKPVKFSGVNIFRIENGKVVELWNHRDDLGAMQQLGAPIYAGSRS